MALYDACRWLVGTGRITVSPFREFVAAMSAGVRDGLTLLDLDYAEDSTADVDLNLVMRESGGIIEVQGTGERGHLTTDDLFRVIEVTSAGIRGLVSAQRDAVA